MSDIAIRPLTMTERHTFGTCPVCGAKQDIACDGKWYDDEGVMNGAHVARLFNAPFYAAVDAQDDDNG